MHYFDPILAAKLVPAPIERIHLPQKSIAENGKQAPTLHPQWIDLHP